MADGNQSAFEAAHLVETLLRMRRGEATLTHLGDALRATEHVADLRGLCTAAGRNALLRIVDAAAGAERIVTAADFERALAELFPRRAAGAGQPQGGYL